LLPQVKSLAAYISGYQGTHEYRCRLGIPDHNEIIVLELEVGRGKVRGARAQQSPFDLVALQVHRRGGFYQA
jgi:hypothetical protein